MAKLFSLSKNLFLAVVAATYVFLYMPLVVLILYSFNQGGFPDAWRGFSLHWYHDLFESVDIWRAFLNSVIIALTSSTLSIAMAVFFIQIGRAHV